MLFPHTESRRIALRPATAADAPKVYDILFRLGRGALPMIDDFVGSFGRGMAATFLIHRKDTEELVGFSTLSELAPPAGHVRAEVNLIAGQPEEILTEASALTANFAFAMWRIRKVYFHATEASVASLGFGGEHSVLVRPEAVFPDHTYFHGRLWDVHVFAIYRDHWDTHGVDLLKQIV
jgi:RimJ/RimL family protein N-acetyltransferase